MIGHLGMGARLKTSSKIAYMYVKYKQFITRKRAIRIRSLNEGIVSTRLIQRLSFTLSALLYTTSVKLISY